MPWYITNGILQQRDEAPSENSIKTDITGEGDVVIPEGVTCIGNSAFFGCGDMTNIIIPSSVQAVGYGAFSFCMNLTHISFPANLAHIEGKVFWWCKRLEDVSFPDRLNCIEKEMFRACIGLENITIPNSVTEIREGAFMQCIHLRNVVMLGEVTSIGKKAFNSCTNLMNIQLAESVTDIGYGAFAGCTKLTEFIIPDGVTKIGRKVFDECSSLTRLMLPKELFKWLNKEKIETLKSICCPISLKNISEDMSQKLCVGFAENQAKYFNELRREYLAYIQQNARRMIKAAFEFPMLLYLMCQEKLISKKDISLFVEEAIKYGKVELIAAILNYQKNMLNIYGGNKVYDEWAEL